MSNTASWHFPPRNGGIDYVQNPSSAHFVDNPIPKLVREILQNSVDAKERGIPEPVAVKFHDTYVDGNLVGALQLSEHMTACLERARAEKHTPAVVETYQDALAELDRDRIRCLCITDSGTTGLSGHKWSALVDQEGAVRKPGEAPGGSYGIGKNAVFNVSLLHTVFYSTNFVNGREGRVERMQGKATLMSHPNPNKPKESLQHIGFYRANESPLTTTQIPGFFRLDEPGTGVFILGFDPRSQDWLGEMTAAVIRNFFLAIHRKQLVVEIKSGSTTPIIISHETVDLLFREHANEDDSYSYYRAIRDTEPAVTKVIPKIGKLNVHVLMGCGPRRIAYVNGNGMLITDSREQAVNPIAPRGKSLWPDYGVVVSPATETGDAWIRNLEPPSHDTISLSKLNEVPRRKASKVFFTARKAIGTIIDKAAEIDRYGDLSNLNELAALFPDELDPRRRGNRALPVVDVPVRPASRPGTEIDPLGPDPDPPAPDPYPSPPTPDPEPKPHPKPRPPRPGPGPNPGSKRRRSLTSVRFIPTGRRQAIIAFTPTGDFDAEIPFSLVPQGGERDREEQVDFTEAQVVDGDHAVAIRDGQVVVRPGRQERIAIRVAASSPINDVAVRIG